MFIKNLIISSEDGIIRDILFRKGINLIVDESKEEVTGNDVGKTTVLKLIDFCLGAKPNGIYVDPESKKDEYALVKNFLKDKKVLITLVLKANLDTEDASEIVIKRNFLSRKEIVRSINGENLSEQDFEKKLTELVFPNHHAEKPTFRQIISHNIRYEDENISNTLKTLDKYTSDAEYETLDLFLLGCDFAKGNLKQQVLSKLQQEYTFKSRLEKSQTKTAYETALSLLKSDIDNLYSRKAAFDSSSNYESNLDKLNKTNFLISKVSSELSRLKIRREVIIEAKEDLESNFSKIDTDQLKIIYEQAVKQISDIQKTFEELVKFHNQMIVEKVKFIASDLPNLESSIHEKSRELSNLLNIKRKFIHLIERSESFDELNRIVSELAEKHRQQGEYEQIVKQIEEVEKEIFLLNTKLTEIDSKLFSDDFENIVKTQKDKFNKFFSSVSSELYGEQYALNYNIITNRKGQKLYKFNTFNTNFSSGKKQGEISCFDIAYTLFADSENMPCFHFILNDKKELMHDNQLTSIANLVNNINVQFIASILRDKLPDELNKEEYFILKLSPNDKLFRINSL